MTTDIPPPRRHSDDAPTPDPMRKVALSGRRALHRHVRLLDPASSGSADASLDNADFVLGAGSDAAVLWATLRGHHRPRRRRHRRRPVPGRPGGSAGSRALGFVDHPRPRGRHDLRRRPQPPVGRRPCARTWPDRRRDPTPSAPSAQALVAIHDWSFLLGPGLIPAINALFLGHGHVPVPPGAPLDPDARPRRRAADPRLDHRRCVRRLGPGLGAGPAARRSPSPSGSSRSAST